MLIFDMIVDPLRFGDSSFFVTLCITCVYSIWWGLDVDQVRWWKLVCSVHAIHVHARDTSTSLNNFHRRTARACTSFSNWDIPQPAAECSQMRKRQRYFTHIDTLRGRNLRNLHRRKTPAKLSIRRLMWGAQIVFATANHFCVHNNRTDDPDWMHICVITVSI